MKNTIRFIDSIMGVGKTTAIINEMNDNYMYEQYIYVTPFLRETERVKASCPNANFLLPESKYGSKTNGLQDLIDSGANISMSHQLLKHLSKDKLEMFGEYHLVLDEVLDLISVYSELKAKDVKLLLDKEFISVDELGLISMTEKGATEIFKLSAYEKTAKLIEEQKLYLYGGKTCILELPIEIITSFKKVTIMSYLIEGSYLYKLLMAHNCNIEKKMIDSCMNIVDYDVELEASRSAEAFGKIKVYAGNGGASDYNLKMFDTAPLLSYSAQSKWTTRDKNKVGKVVSGYFRSIGTTSDEALFSNFGEQLPVTKFNSCFLSYNSRATNDYAHKKHLAYIIDKNPNPALVNYCKSKYGFSVNEDMLTLDSMLQWIFRSAIRNGEEVTLFLPSLKMRRLLHKWGTNFGELV